MKVEFERIGVGCDICIAKSAVNCRQCERNPAILKLKDMFKRPDKKPPAPPPGLGGSKSKISEANRAELASWGIRPDPEAPSDRFQPPPSDVEERPRSDPPPEDMAL